MSRMSQHTSVIAQNDTSVLNGVTAWTREDRTSHENEVLVDSDMNKRSSVRFLGYFSQNADIDRRLGVHFSISSLELPFAVINPLSAFSIVFRSLCSRKYGVDEYIRLK